jgi:hypothetical protein
VIESAQANLGATLLLITISLGVGVGATKKLANVSAMTYMTLRLDLLNGFLTSQKAKKRPGDVSSE